MKGQPLTAPTRQAGVSCFVGQEIAEFKVQFFVGSSVVKTLPAYSCQPLAVSLKTIQTMTTVHKIKLKISNCYLIEGDGKILVDTGSPGEAKTIIRELKKRNVELRDLSLILHTHGHSDHCGSTTELLQ